jgi:hypothetical protein
MKENLKVSREEQGTQFEVRSQTQVQGLTQDGKHHQTHHQGDRFSKCHNGIENPLKRGIHSLVTGSLKKILCAIVFLGSFYSLESQALIHLRLGTTSMASQASGYNQFLNDYCLGCDSKAGLLRGLTGDLLVNLPLIPIGFGLRYDSLEDKIALGGTDNVVTQAANIVSVLVNYRLWDTLFFVGPIMSYGVSHSGHMSLKQQGVEQYRGTGKWSSYSVGLEAGLKLGLFQVGAELGQSSISMTGIRNNQSQVWQSPGEQNLEEIKRSGLYSRIFVSVGF